MDFKEVNIPAPWGFIAAKLYGKEEDEPILVVHGLQDNAGTFDRLMPLLPTCFYYICIDLPGHGKSSHYPPGLPIFSMSYIIVYKMVMDHFDKKQYIILGHSYGGQLGLRFTQLYPHYVKKLIMLDTVHLLPVSTSIFKNTFTDTVDKLFAFQSKAARMEPPAYTYEEALNKLQQYRYVGELNEEAAKALLVRTLLPAPDGKFKFSLDQRLKFIVNPLHDIRYITELLKKNPIKCPVLIVLASETFFAHKYMAPVLKELKKQRNCIVKYVEGNHDVHNNSPEVVAPLIIKFLSYQRSKI